MTSLRIAIFTHDTFGLGHVRRSLHFARALARLPKSAVLLITGSPALHAFDRLPQNVDVVKIPTVARTGDKSLRPPHLPLPLNEVTDMRSGLVQTALHSFDPDVFLVDNFALGSRGELRPVLETLKETRTRTVLGLRDILDSPESVCADWSRQGMYSVLEDLYDRILVYGSPEILDVVSAYEIPAAVEKKLTYCGYVTAVEAGSAAPDLSALGIKGPFLLATGGGGGDGYPLLRAVADAAPFLSVETVLMVTGPLMSPSLRDEIRGLAEQRSGLIVRDFIPGLSDYMPAAELVVSMCGYNTAAEILARKARALVVPRTWRYGEHRRGEAAGIEWEQRIRAESLSRLGLLNWMDPNRLTGESLARHINQALAAPSRNGSAKVELDGIERVTRELLSLAGSPRGRRTA